MRKLIWCFRYAWYMQKKSRMPWWFCWTNAKESYRDITSDGDIRQYDPIASAIDEMSYWND